MLKVAYAETNCFSLIILLLIYWNIRKRMKSVLFEQKLFLYLLCTNAVMLVLDTVQWFLEGNAGETMRAANLLITTVYYALNPLPCILWAMYVAFQVYRSRNRIRLLTVPLLLPFLTNLFFSVASIWTGTLFYFDLKNGYHRGRQFFLMAGICLLYLGATQIFIARKHRQINEEFFIPLFLFAIPPIVGTVLQSFLYGISMVWSCMTLSIVIIFLNIQNSQLYHDHLTGLYNRRQLDFTLREWIEREGFLAGIMIDINKFKEINDHYGHAMGDQALIDAGKILSMSFSKTDLVCRYGGDEFIIILKIKSRADLQRAVNRIHVSLEKYQEKKKSPYVLSFSIGCDIYSRGLSAKQFIRHIDNLMYQDKKRQRNKWQATDLPANT